MSNIYHIMSRISPRPCYVMTDDIYRSHRGKWSYSLDNARKFTAEEARKFIEEDESNAEPYAVKTMFTLFQELDALSDV